MFGTDTELGKLLMFFNEHRNKWYRSLDFMKQNSNPYIGYEAPTRIGDLKRLGLIESRRYEQNGKYVEYKLKDNIGVTVVEGKKVTYELLKPRFSDKLKRLFTK